MMEDKKKRTEDMLKRLQGNEKCPYCGNLTAKFGVMDEEDDIFLGCSNLNCPSHRMESYPA